jgi:hypothetical protein
MTQGSARPDDLFKYELEVFRKEEEVAQQYFFSWLQTFCLPSVSSLPVLAEIAFHAGPLGTASGHEVSLRFSVVHLGLSPGQKVTKGNQVTKRNPITS